MRYSMLFLAGMILLQGCGYSLRMVDVAEENRDVRNKREMEEHVLQLDAQMRAMQEKVARLQSELKQEREESRKAISDIQKRRADADVRFDENDVQFRMIQGRIEKEERRRADLTQQIDNIAYRVNEQEKKGEVVQKALQTQIEEIKKINAGLQKNGEDQDKRLKETAGQILQLTRDIPASLSAQATQLDDLGKQIQQMNRGTDVEQLSKSLVDLSNALNLLGEKITAKVDQQEKLLDKTTKRLQVLESKVTPRGKKSSLQEEVSEGRSPVEVGGAVSATGRERSGF